MLIKMGEIKRNYYKRFRSQVFLIAPCNCATKFTCELEQQ